MRWWAVLIVVLSFTAAAHGALQITSVGPDIASPGELVVVTGGPFGPEVEILVGEVLIRPQTIEDRRLTFRLPDLLPGQYLLRLVEDERVSFQTFNLRVLEPLPQVAAIVPETIEACPSGPLPGVAVVGSGFLPGARLLLDGAAIPLESITGTEIRFTPPRLNPGLHQVVVVNPGGSTSLPQSLLADGQPEIDTVEQGADYVTSYEVIIRGRNFLGSSQLVVDGRLVPLTDAGATQEGRGIYVDCGTIRYIRFPYSSEPKSTSLQILNPGGQQSAVYQVAIP